MRSNHRNATPEQVAKIESVIDASLEGLPLPAHEYFEALWHFLTVSEDLPRMVILRRSGSATSHGESDETMRLSSLLGDHKYALRYVMEVVKRRLPKAQKLQKRIQAAEVPYKNAERGLAIARDYKEAAGLFSLYHSGDAFCTTDESGNHLWFGFPGHSEAYLALGYSIDVDEPRGNVITALFSWLRYPDHAPAVVKQIGHSVAPLDMDRLVYDFDEGTATELAGIFQNPESWNLVPLTWVFPWGSRAEVMSLWNSLQLRCAYHLLAINFGASRSGIIGGGLDDLCLRIKRGQLVQDIKRVSNASLDRIVRFVHGMTYGKSTRTPDPALQPLIPCGADEFLVPCMHVVSSKCGRNLLSLHARVDEKSFNSQSAAFEQAMVRVVAGLASACFSFVRTQFHFGPTGEIDLIIVDERSGTILIGELRWMIQPGDPRETVNRIKVCREKVMQMEKKIRGVKNNTPTLLRRLGWKGGKPATWEVVGLVITENFVFRSSDTDIPMLPMAVLRVGLNSGMNARQLHRWLKSEKWLPKKGQHFEIGPDQVQFGPHMLGQYGLTNLRPLEYIREFLPTTVKEFIEPKA